MTDFAKPDFAKPSALAPFRIRNYRFQWPADLLTSWAFEMEAIILGWYVLVTTGSVLLLSIVVSLNYVGTLAALWQLTLRGKCSEAISSRPSGRHTSSPSRC